MYLGAQPKLVKVGISPGQRTSLGTSKQQNGRVNSPSRRIYCNFKPPEIDKIGAKALGKCTYANTNRCRPSASIQLMARYHVSILPGWLIAHLDMSFAPRGPIILFPSRKCRTKPLFPKLDINLLILGGPSTLACVSTAISVVVR